MHPAPRAERRAMHPLSRLLAIAVVGSGCSYEPEGEASLLFEGDSDIENWDTTGYSNSANVGVGGSVCWDVLDSIEETLQAYQPSRVVLVCGENDLWDQSVSATFDDFSAVVSSIQDHGADVYYMGTKPEPSTTMLHTEYREYDALIRAHATDLATAGETPLVMIDVYPGFETAGNPDSLYEDDGLHLSEAGYALWDSWLTEALDAQGCILWESGSCTGAAPD